MSELTKPRTTKKLHLGFCVWCDFSFWTHAPQAKFCRVDCKNDHKDAKRSGQIKERHQAAISARLRERDAAELTAKTVTEGFGEIFGVEWAP